MPASRIGVLDVRHIPFSPQRQFRIWGILTDCGVTLSAVQSQVRLCLCPSYPRQCMSFVFCGVGSVHLGLKSFTEENYSLCSCKFVVHMGGEFRVILDAPQFIFISEKSYIWSVSNLSGHFVLSFFFFIFLSFHFLFLYIFHMYNCIFYFFKYFIYTKLMVIFFCLFLLSLSLKKISFL